MRKTVKFPRIIAIGDKNIKAVLRFKAKDWSREDILTVDIDKVKLTDMKMRRSIPADFTEIINMEKELPQFLDPKAKSEYEWSVTYSFEVKLPVCSDMSEIGFTMTKRTDITSDVVIKDINVVLHQE